MQRLTPRAWCVMLTAAMLVTACAGSTAGKPNDGGAGANGKPAQSFLPLPGGEPPLDPATVANANPRSVPAPIAAYVWDDASARTVSRARIIVGDKCMRAFGFSPVPGWQPEGTVSMLTWTRYGLWDDVAAQRGYDPPEVNGGNPYPVRYLGVDATNVYLGMVQELHGQAVPAGGCQGQEFTTVMQPKGLPTVDGRYVANLDSEALARATQDSRVVPPLAAWKSCMKQAGWDYADVQAPFAYWSNHRQAVDKFHVVVSDTEKRNAQADLGCKRSTKLLGTWLAADVAYQMLIVEREGERLREYQNALAMILDNAGKIIAEG